MSRFSARILLTFFFSTASCLAQDGECSEKYGHRNETCICGSSLENLTVATPRGMVLEAVCGLAETDLGVPRPIDLGNEKVSLDTFTDSGGYYWGTLFFGGTIETTGELAFLPSDSGLWWFTPTPGLAPYESVFADNYLSILLDKELPRDPPDLPKDLAPPPGFMSCLRTQMNIRFNRLEVELSERGGAYVHGLQLLSPFEYEQIAC